MAHQLTPEQVDEAAAQIAAGEEPAREEHLSAEPGRPVLVYGAEGANVAQLVNLLAVVGQNSNAVIKGGAPKLDESVLVDVRAAQAQLDIVEPALAGVEGEIVGPATWGALYEAAAAAIEAREGAAS
jgi:hypothetical protein